MKQPLEYNNDRGNARTGDDGHDSIGRPELVYTTNPLVPAANQARETEPMSTNYTDLFANYARRTTGQINGQGSVTGLTGLPSPRPGSSISDKPINIDLGYVDGHNPMAHIVGLAQERREVTEQERMGGLRQNPFLG